MFMDIDQRPAIHVAVYFILYSGLFIIFIVGISFSNF